MPFIELTQLPVPASCCHTCKQVSLLYSVMWGPPTPISWNLAIRCAWDDRYKLHSSHTDVGCYTWKARSEEIVMSRITRYVRNAAKVHNHWNSMNVTQETVTTHRTGLQYERPRSIYNHILFSVYSRVQPPPPPKSAPVNINLSPITSLSSNRTNGTACRCTIP